MLSFSSLAMSSWPASLAAASAVQPSLALMPLLAPAARRCSPKPVESRPPGEGVLDDVDGRLSTMRAVSDAGKVERQVSFERELERRRRRQPIVAAARGRTGGG